MPSSAKWSGRRGHQVVVKDGVFYLFGGYDGYDGVSDRNNKNDVWKWSGDEGDDWQVVSAHEDNPTKKWTGRVAHQVVLKGEEFYLFGGATPSHKNDVWKSSDGASWTNVSPDENITEKWEDRLYHQVVVKGGELYLMGGHNTYTGYNDVWKSSDGASWTKLLESAGWTGRTAHEVVVKDGEFYLMGGNYWLYNV